MCTHICMCINLSKMPGTPQNLHPNILWIGYLKLHTRLWCLDLFLCSYVYWSASSLAGVQTLNLRTNIQSSFSRKRRQVALATSPLALALDPVSGALWISTGAGHILTYTSGTLKVVVNATALSVGSNIGRSMRDCFFVFFVITKDMYCV